MAKRYKTADEMRSAFIKQGWDESTSFAELTREQAKKAGLWFALHNEHKYFVMQQTGNVYADTGEIACYKIFASCG